HTLSRSILQDREGNLWIGTDGGGVNRLKPRAVRSLGMRDGMTSAIVMSASQSPNGDFWFGLHQGAVNRLRDGRIEIINHPPELVTNAFVWPVMADRRGGVWIGPYGGGLVYHRNGGFQLFDSKSGLDNDVILALLEDRRGMVWAGGSRGL